MPNHTIKNFNLFFAIGTKHYLELLLICNVKNILISFAYKAPWAMHNIIKRNHINLLCDSGAFTAWSLASKRKQQGDPNWRRFLVNIDQYFEHLERYKHIIKNAVNLDVIPGEQGVKPTQEQIIEAAEQGWKNYLYLKSKGWDTIHVYHQGEPLWVLDRMLADCSYIGVSPCNDSPEKLKLEWLDNTFRYIHNSKNPKIKTHGFAVTNTNLMKRYPWYSCDSATFSLTAAMGTILTPFGRVYLSEQGQNDPDHIVNKPKEILDHIEQYLQESIGYGISSMTKKTEETEIECPKCQTSFKTTKSIYPYKIRHFANIDYYLDVEKNILETGPTNDYLKQTCLSI